MSKKENSNVDRRSFLKQTGAAVAATAATTSAAIAKGTDPSDKSETGVASPALAKGIYDLRMTLPWAEAPFGLSDQAHQLAQAIETLSDDKFKISLTHNTSHDASDSELQFDTEQTYVEAHPAFAYFGGLPIRQGLTARDLETWLSVGGGQDLWDSLAGDFDHKPLLAGHLGERPGLWTTNPIHHLDDLRDARIYALGLGSNILSAIGAKPVQLDHRDFDAAFASKEITAVEFSGPYISHMMGIHKHAKHVATGGIHLNGSTLSLRVKRNLWDGLPTSLQAALTAAAAQSYRSSLAENQTHTALIKQGMSQHDGVKFSPFHAEIRATLCKVAETVVAQTAGMDTLTRHIDTSYMAFRNTISEPLPLM